MEDKQKEKVKWDKIVIATRNKGKAKEFINILAPYANEIVTLDAFEGIPEVVEDGTTFEQNAKKKAETIQSIVKLPTLADDSGLVVDALNGDPGIYSARYSGENATDEKNNIKILSALENVPIEKRTARFVSHIALAIPNEKTISVEDVIEGQIIEHPKGNHGFGYDPIFYLPALQKTMAQLESSEKNKISHRAKAMKKLVSVIESSL